MRGTHACRLRVMQRAAGRRLSRRRRGGMVNCVVDDLERIERLRASFLRDEPGLLHDYWRDEADLSAYDGFLAARIGWKWDAALATCEAAGLDVPTDVTVLDFGCGSGVAARRFAACFPVRRLQLHDRSRHAMAFAERRCREQCDVQTVETCPDVRSSSPDVLLISHVLSELDERGERELGELIVRSRMVLWVESGNRAVARRLSAWRERLLAEFDVVAPCPHAAACPALANDDDWCHFFAQPPGFVFTDGEWVKRSKQLGIDLRSLPYSFLCLAPQGEVSEPSRPARRALGRARINPRTAKVMACTETGLEAVEVHKRHDAAGWRALKKAPEQPQRALS